MTGKDEVREIMIIAVKEYERAFNAFRGFRSSKLGRSWDDTLSAFIHDSNRNRSNLEYAIETDDIPVGRVSRTWQTYHAVLTATGIMDLILSLNNKEAIQ